MQDSFNNDKEETSWEDVDRGLPGVGIGALSPDKPGKWKIILLITIIIIGLLGVGIFFMLSRGQNV